VVDDSDWRITDQEQWLAGRTLRWADWTSPKPDLDHDHCTLCWAEFAPTKTDHVDFIAGWVTDDDENTWVCPDCMEDFKERFRLKTFGP
jgi:rubredoxin